MAVDRALDMIRILNAAIDLDRKTRPTLAQIAKCVQVGSKHLKSRVSQHVASYAVDRLLSTLREAVMGIQRLNMTECLWWALDLYRSRKWVLVRFRQIMTYLAQLPLAILEPIQPGFRFFIGVRSHYVDGEGQVMDSYLCKAPVGAPPSPTFSIGLLVERKEYHDLIDLPIEFLFEEPIKDRTFADGLCTILNDLLGWVVDTGQETEHGFVAWRKREIEREDVCFLSSPDPIGVASMDL